MSEEKGAGGAPLAKTPLAAEHEALGAKMVPFAGYLMPVQYSGTIEEHKAVRERAGLFDVSHMGEVLLEGPDAGRLVDLVTPSRLSDLEIGRVAYSCLTTERGTFVDDVLCYRLADERFMFVVNASNRAKAVDWIRAHAEGLSVEIDDASDRMALIACQGPLARGLVASLAEGFDGKTVKYYRVVEGRLAGVPVRASRTGYTGEQGYEIFTAPEDAPKVWNALLEAGREQGVMPAGLGARDTLRLEAGLPLYGNDIDETITVLEADLEFTIDWSKERFVGHEALRREKEQGRKRRRIGFAITGRGIARHGHDVRRGEALIGTVGSGSYSPTLEKAIGMATLAVEYAEPGREVKIDVRGREVEAETVALPFYRRPKSKKSSSS